MMSRFTLHLVSWLGFLALLQLQSCAPALMQDSSSLEFKVIPAQSQVGQRSSALKYESSVFELSDEYCYGFHITGDHPLLRRLPPKAEDAQCKTGPQGLGMIAGLFSKGDVAELEIPLGPQRRFDLLAIPRSALKDGNCKKNLTAEAVSRPATDSTTSTPSTSTNSTSTATNTGSSNTSSQDDKNVDLFVDGQKLSQEITDGMRFIATRTLDISAGTSVVELEAVSLDPKGLEYGCHHSGDSSNSGSPDTSNDSSNNSSGGSTTPVAAPGSSSANPLTLTSPHLLVISHHNGDLAPTMDLTISGLCSDVGQEVTVQVAGASTQMDNCHAGNSAPVYDPNSQQWLVSPGTWSVTFSYITGGPGIRDFTLQMAGVPDVPLALQLQ